MAGLDGPQERIGGKLLRDGRGQRRLALLGKRGGLRGARAQRLVLRLDGQREAAIIVGIFVAAIERGLRRQAA